MLAVALAAALAATGFYVARTPSSPRVEASAPEIYSAPQPQQSPAVHAHPVALPVLARRVSLAIAPPDASVEIDGASTPMIDGFVQIEGSLGSVHRVRITKGKAELTGDVIVTEAGAIPPKMELKRDPRPTVAAPVSPRSGAHPEGVAPNASGEVARPKPAATDNPLVPDSFQ